jgi:cell division septation protein DedD
MQAQMGVSQYPSTPTASFPQAYQATPQAENPYKEAFNRVVGLLSSPVQFPFQGQQYSQNQAYDQANYASPQTPQYNNWETGTYTPGTNNSQEYWDDSSQTSSEITEEMLLANGVSEESLDVLDHFGADAPAVLNQAYETILTNPDILADYTCEFFGENGPYPIPDSEIGYGRPQAQAVGTQYQRPSAPERPQMPVPPQPQAQGNPEAFWNNFGALAERDPSNAWRYLNSAQQNPEVFRQKLLVME